MRIIYGWAVLSAVIALFMRNKQTMPTDRNDEYNTHHTQYMCYICGKMMKDDCANMLVFFHFDIYSLDSKEMYTPE